MQERYMSPKTVKSIYGISASTLRRWEKEHGLTLYRTQGGEKGRGDIRILEQELRELLGLPPTRPRSGHYNYLRLEEVKNKYDLSQEILKKWGDDIEVEVGQSPRGWKRYLEQDLRRMLGCEDLPMRKQSDGYMETPKEHVDEIEGTVATGRALREGQDAT